MRKVYCPGCGEFQQYTEEAMHTDERNPYAWGDLLCAKCHLVIATFSEWPDEEAPEEPVE